MPFFAFAPGIRKIIYSTNSLTSSAMVEMTAMLQWRFLPRSEPREARISNSVSSQSVLARRCSHDDAASFRLGAPDDRLPSRTSAL
ncbi:hypothetical protein J6524_35560 [Bradyrhizobium sp. WSM 1738]|nr:hypothetical protein [Bradyrhizobium hereditatis]